MGLIFRLGLRNLLRQKRRNIMLGSSIAIGVMLLVMASSLSNGIIDVFFNKILSYAFGHVLVDVHEKGGANVQIFRDREYIINKIKETIPNDEIVTANESIGINARAVANGNAVSSVLVGMPYKESIIDNQTAEQQKEVMESFKILQGKWDDILRKDLPNPMIIPEEKANELDVKLHDNVNVRFQNIYGQWQSATLTVVAIIKTENSFMNAVMFIQASRLKELLGYKPYEMAPIQVNLKNVKLNGKKYADELHKKLHPEIANIFGIAKSGSKTADVNLLGFKGDEKSVKEIKKIITLTEGDAKESFAKSGVLMSKALAEEMGIKTGDTFDYTYKNKRGGNETTVNLKLSGIFTGTGSIPEKFILLNEEKFYSFYYENVPETAKGSYKPVKTDKFGALLATEWILLDRSKNSNDLMQKMKDFGKKKWKGTTVDVNSVYESASAAVMFADIINFILLIGVIVLFIIILVGLINTIRMTVRERTREIGTIRAVGMKKSDVRNMFLAETFLMTLFASAAGTVMAFIFMFLISLITFSNAGFISIFLVKKHIHFMPTVDGILINVLAVIIVTLLTAFIPARRAAKMQPSEALRHYE